jgi:hypothetical protein
MNDAVRDEFLHLSPILQLRLERSGKSTVLDLLVPPCGLEVSFDLFVGVLGM